MPSLADVANDLKGLLGDIKNNTAATTASVNQLVNINVAGFANLSAGMAVIIDRVQETNALLDENRQQNDTIICWLTNMANVLCEQLRRLEAQEILQRSMNAHLERLEAIDHLVHAREFVEVLAQEETNRRIDECCPPDRPAPTPCFEACPSPKHRPFPHSGAKFEPLPPPSHIG